MDRINKVVLSSHNLLATLAQLHSTLCKTEFGNKIVPVYKNIGGPAYLPPLAQLLAGKLYFLIIIEVIFYGLLEFLIYSRPI